MFEETTYINDQNGQEYPIFIMNRDVFTLLAIGFTLLAIGFTLLAIGFTGKKALKFLLHLMRWRRH